MPQRGAAPVRGSFPSCDNGGSPILQGFINMKPYKPLREAFALGDPRAVEVVKLWNQGRNVDYIVARIEDMRVAAKAAAPAAAAPAAAAPAAAAPAPAAAAPAAAAPAPAAAAPAAAAPAAAAAAPAAAAPSAAAAAPAAAAPRAPRPEMPRCGTEGGSILGAFAMVPPFISLADAFNKGDVNAVKVVELWQGDVPVRDILAFIEKVKAVARSGDMVAVSAPPIRRAEEDYVSLAKVVLDDAENALLRNAPGVWVVAGKNMRQLPKGFRPVSFDFGEKNPEAPAFPVCQHMGFSEAAGLISGDPVAAAVQEMRGMKDPSETETSVVQHGVRWMLGSVPPLIAALRWGGRDIDLGQSFTRYAAKLVKVLNTKKDFDEGRQLKAESRMDQVLYLARRAHQDGTSVLSFPPLGAPPGSRLFQGRTELFDTIKRFAMGEDVIIPSIPGDCYKLSPTPESQGRVKKW